MKGPDLKVSYINTADLCSFSAKILAYLKAAKDDNETLSGVMTLLSRDIDAAGELLNIKSQSGNIKQNPPENKTENKLHELKAVIAKNLADKDEHKRKAALYLDELYKPMEKSKGDSHVIYTTKMQLFFHSLESDESLKALKVIGGEAVVHNLLNDEADRHVTLHNGRTKEALSKKQRIRNIRKQLTHHLLFVIDFARVLEEMNKGRYTEMVAQINEAIRTIMASTEKSRHQKYA